MIIDMERVQALRLDPQLATPSDVVEIIDALADVINARDEACEFALNFLCAVETLDCAKYSNARVRLKALWKVGRP
jgi:hypothetical protein